MLNDYIQHIKPMYSVCENKSVLEIAVGNHVRLIPIYNHYNISSYIGIEPYPHWYKGSIQTLEDTALFPFKMHNCEYQQYNSTDVVPDVVVCNGLAYHLHSPYHLFEYLANINAEYIILETTGVPLQQPDWGGSITTNDTMDRIKGTMQQHEESFEDYLMRKSTTFHTFEQQNTPGNSNSTNRRAIPWSHSGMNPDMRVLAFWCMGYDLDDSLERDGQDKEDKSKDCITVYRFKRSKDITRDPKQI